MRRVKLYIAADHRGYERKNLLKSEIKFSNLEIIDLGADKLESSDDFVDYAQKLSLSILADDAEAEQSLGILICGSGQGMCMAANRFRGIRACLPMTEHQAIASKREDDCNVICISADSLNLEKSIAIIEAWLESSFSFKQRYIRRIEKLDQI